MYPRTIYRTSSAGLASLVQSPVLSKSNRKDLSPRMKAGGRRGITSPTPITWSSQCAIKSCAVNEIRRGREVVLQLAARRRSRCGVLRGWPVPSSHFSPGFAPQVGQRIANIRFAGTSFFFMRARLCQRKGMNTVQFCTPISALFHHGDTEKSKRLSPRINADQR
jgi:hypothetical protein